MFGWLKKTAKVHPAGPAMAAHRYEKLQGKTARKNREKEREREAESDAKNRKAKREGTGGRRTRRRRRTMRY
jgi:hypothetical protein